MTAPTAERIAAARRWTAVAKDVTTPSSDMRLAAAMTGELLAALDHVAARLREWRRAGLVRSDGKYAIDELLAYIAGTPEAGQ